MAVFTNNPMVGIDISHYDYSIDVKLLLDAGVRVFILKIGQNSILDSSFYTHANNVAKYTSQGAILQVYYWDEITNSSQTQADWLVREVKISGLPITCVWLDDEQWWNIWSQYYQAVQGGLAYSAVAHPSPANLSGHFKTTYDAVAAGLGASKVGIYTNKGFVDEHATVPSGVAGTSMGTWMGAAKVNMWIPYYGYQSNPRSVTTMSWNIWKQNWFPNYTPPIPTGTYYTQMRAHQCTGDRCQLPGVYKNIWKQLSTLDINVLDGVWAAGGTPPTPLPPPQNTYVAIYTLNIHSQPNQTSPVIGYVQQHSEVVVYETSGDYARIDPALQKWVYKPYLQKV
jgi:hypothetical protein